MQACGNCGEYNPEESTFCGRCGNRLNNKCPDCHFPNLPNQQFCGSCGKQLLGGSDLPGSAVSYGQAPAVPPVPAPSPPSLSEMVAKAKDKTLDAIQSSSMPTNAEVIARARELREKIGVSGLKGLLPKAPGVSDEEQTLEVADLPVIPSDGIRRLEQYAVLSIEMVADDIISGMTQDTQDEMRGQMTGMIRESLSSVNAQVELSKNHVLFASFREEDSLGASIVRAIQASFTLLWEDTRFASSPFKLRIGLDLDNANSRNALTATTERMIASPGSIVTGRTVLPFIQDFYDLEEIGPLNMHGRSLVFYKILAPGTATAATYDDPPHPDADGWADSSLQAPPAPIPEEIPYPDSAAQYPADLDSPTENVQQAYESALTAAAGESASTWSDQPLEDIPAGDSPVSQEPELPRVKWEPPQFGSWKAPRESNLNYERTLEALTTEISGFLAQGTTTKGRILTLCAPDGLGKSNMSFMARHQVDPSSQRAAWLGAQNYRSFAGQMPLYFWLELIQNPLGLIFEGQVGRDVQDMIHRLLSTIHAGAVPPEQEAFLTDFLSVNRPRPLSADARGSIGLVEDFLLAFFKTLSSKKPVVIMMEDINFADAASLDLLVRLLDRGLLEMPVLLLLTQSTDFYAAGPLANALQKVNYKELVISPLNETEAQTFMNQGPLGGNLHAFPPHLIDLLVKHAGGSSLYIEEGLRLFFQQGVLSVDPQSGKFLPPANYSPGVASLTPRLDDLILDRLDWAFRKETLNPNLSPDELAKYHTLLDNAQYVLNLASVIGERFSLQFLMDAAQLEKPDFDNVVKYLFDHGFIAVDTVNTARFRHGFIWETVYASLEPEMRFQMHQFVSEVLENDFTQNFTVNPMLIARHAEQGGMPNRALNHWNLAGIYAAHIGSLAAMNQSMFRALNILDQTTTEPLHQSEMALRIYESLGTMNLDLDPPLAVDMLNWVITARRGAGEDARLIEPLGFLASAYENKGDYPRALETLDQVLALVDSKTYPLEAASLLLSKMEYLFMLGRLQNARELIEHSLEPVGTPDLAHQDPGFYEAFLNIYLIKAQVLVAQGEPDLLQQTLDMGLHLARERNQRGLDLALQLIQGQAYLRQGQYESCNREAEGLLNAIEAMEDPDWFLAQWGLLAMMYHCEMSDWESASQLVLTVMTNSEHARDYQTWVMAQVYAGYIKARSGFMREGIELLEKALEFSAEYRFASCALLGWRLLAELELMRGNRDVAIEIAAKAIDIAGKPEIQNRYELLKLSLAQAQGLVENGDVRAAGKILEPLWPQAVKTRYQPLIADTSFEIGRLYKRMAQDAPADLSQKHLVRSKEFFLKSKAIWLELHHMPNVKKVDAFIPQM